MSGVLSSVDARTKLVGQNRLELLLFHLGGSQHFAKKHKNPTKPDDRMKPKDRRRSE